MRARDRIVEVCEREFDRMLKEARDEARIHRQSVPIIGGEFKSEQHAKLMVGRALAAQEWHAKTAIHTWAIPLRLRMEECESLMYNDNNALKLMGYFGRSMRWNDWNLSHPTFPIFCSGVIESIYCPMMKMDRELVQMFPPKPLAGLTTPLHWRCP